MENLWVMTECGHRMSLHSHWAPHFRIKVSSGSLLHVHDKGVSIRTNFLLKCGARSQSAVEKRLYRTNFNKTVGNLLSLRIVIFISIHHYFSSFYSMFPLTQLSETVIYIYYNTSVVYLRTLRFSWLTETHMPVEILSWSLNLSMKMPSQRRSE